ncbi:MAG: hypothetical protein LBI28_10855, partial [Treponema sp.]|nr:hypothetical protein [Treponema sp.]
GYIGSRAGIEVEKALSDFSRLPYFAEGQQQTVTGYSSFKGCTGLSADSRQTIRDSGYEGEF